MEINHPNAKTNFLQLHTQPDKKAVAKALNAIREQRARFASQGITLSELTGPNKTLREVMHENHY